jgi:3-deoxy-manno-octulosonate cytidylyltransferase (CMP-KDO synthetase)
VFAFRREALLHFNYLPETFLEIAESVDMNRVIEAGGAVRMLLTESPMLSVDTAEDLAAAEIAITSQPVTATYNFQAY